MKNLFEKFNIEITQRQLNLFEEYRKILLFYNDKFNITSITEENEVNEKHFLDSVLCKSLFVDNSKVIEIGSGGGFPSIPLKIMREDLSFTLVEATGKKCTFLKEVVKELKLDGVEVINGRAEVLATSKEFRENFDHATARAVARLNVLCEYCMPFVKVGGSFISLKGKAEEEIEEAKNAIKVLGGKIEKVENYQLPIENSTRAIIKINKISSTPSSYPRGNGKERKMPL